MLDGGLVGFGFWVEGEGGFVVIWERGEDRSVRPGALSQRERERGERREEIAMSMTKIIRYM